LIGFAATVSTYAADTIAFLIGADFNVSGFSGNTTTNAYGGRFKVTNPTGGRMVNVVGVEIQPTTVAGSTDLAVGLRIWDVTGAGYNAALMTYAGNVIFNAGQDGASDLTVRGDTDANCLVVKSSTDRVGIGTGAPATKQHTLLTDAGTNAVVDVVTIGHDTSGTAAAGFGAGLAFKLESGTTPNQSAARLVAVWNDTAKADLVGYASDASGEREGWRVRADGSAPAVSLYGVQPVAQATIAGAAATFSQLSGNAVNDASTFDGYTIGQVVKALRNIGALA